MSEKGKYLLDGKTFVQKPLVIGQWKQLGNLLSGTEFPSDLSPLRLVIALGDNLFTALAIILTEEGKSPKDKNLAALAAEIEFGITPEQAIEVISDFFELNPIPSLLKNLSVLAEQLRAKMTEIGSMSSASKSAEATSPGGIGSSGTSPSEKPDGGPNEPSDIATSG